MYPVLSMRQPWAGYLITGKKTLETRTWQTNYKGKLLIHASGKWDKRAKEDSARIRKNIWGNTDVGNESWKLRRTRLIIGIVELVWISVFRNIYEFEISASSHLCVPSEDYYDPDKPKYGWLIKDPVEFPDPVPAKGRLNLWYPDEELWEKINTQITRSN